MSLEPESAPGGGEDSVAAIVLAQADRLLAQHVTPKLLAACDGATGEAAWPAALWAALEENGLPLALVPEEAGGIGLDPATAARLVRACGTHALPLPLPETLAGRALWAAGGGNEEGSLTLAPEGPVPRLSRAAGGWTLDGEVRQLPWGGAVDAILVDALDPEGRPVIARVPGGSPIVESRRNLAGEPRDTLAFAGTRLPESAVRPLPPWLPPEGGAVATVGAWIRAQQIAGAAARCLAYAVAHAGERQQFGRAIGRFQAVQHMLADAAGEVAAATSAADIAGAAWGGPGFGLATAVAKARCGEAAGRVAEICQQVHGAMGFTHEHPLHFSTRRLWSWRDEFGGDALWQERIGRGVCAAGGTALWPMLVRLRTGR